MFGHEKKREILIVFFFHFRSVCVIDDQEEDLVNNKDNCALLRKISSIYVHHRKLRLILCLQTFECFYKRHVLNPVLYQSTALFLFRSVSTFNSLKRWLNSYQIRLRGKESLYDIYRRYILGSKWAYLVLDLSPFLSEPRCYSQILRSDPRPMLLFSVK